MATATAKRKQLKVTQVRSGIGRTDDMNRTLKGLGLRGPRSEAVVANTPAFRGAIKKVIHLVTVEEIDG
jgi:large subunit ribosomal protein L30